MYQESGYIAEAMGHGSTSTPRDLFHLIQQKLPLRRLLPLAARREGRVHGHHNVRFEELSHLGSHPQHDGMTT